MWEDITTLFDAYRFQLSFEYSANSIDFADRELAHEFHDCVTVIGDLKLPIGLVDVGGNLCNLRISSNPG